MVNGLEGIILSAIANPADSEYAFGQVRCWVVGVVVYCGVDDSLDRVLVEQIAWCFVDGRIGFDAVIIRTATPSPD